MAEPGVERVDLPSGHTIYYNPGQHSYWTGFDEATGKRSGRLAGVSTVAKALDTNADPLITWGAKLEAQGACELLEACSSEEERNVLLGGGGEALHRELVSAQLDWRSVRDRRATEGTTIHEDVFAALARGERPSLANVPDEIRGYGQAAFRFWLDHDPEPIAVEQVVYLPEDGVAGRFDLLAKVGGEIVLFDAKTSKRAYLSHHVQLAGYELACVLSGFPAPRRSQVVLLRPNGEYELVDGCATVADWEAAHVAYTATKRIARAERAGFKDRQAVAA